MMNLTLINIHIETLISLSLSLCLLLRLHREQFIMGETGKRSRNQNDGNGDGRNQKRSMYRDEKDGDELIVYRILCPDKVIGNVIGKGGKVINSVRHETRAKIQVVDPIPGAKDRVITIYCYVKEKKEVDLDQEFSDEQLLCPAQDALLKMHATIAKSVATLMESDKKQRDEAECNILVPASQSANIIGKSGATIKKLRSKTRAHIKVIPKDVSDASHSCAMEFDNFIKITGDSEPVKKAVFAISAIMYKFAPKEEIPLDTSVPVFPPSIIIPADVPIYPAGGLFSGVDHIASPRYVPPLIDTHVPELQGYADAGNTWPVYSSSLPVASGYRGSVRSEELSIRVICPSDKVGRVIGKGGSTIKSVRQASGANIEINDKKKDNDCVITITSTESSDDMKSRAVEAVLLLQEKINEEADHVSMQLLVSKKNIGCVIGKSGSIINEIRKRTKASILISKGDRPKCAEASDEYVEVSGDVKNVRDALVQIMVRLRDGVLREKDTGNNLPVTDSLYSTVGPSMPSVLPSVPPVAHLGYEPRSEARTDYGFHSSGGGLYKYESSSMADDTYGSVPSYSSKRYGGIPPPSTLEILIPGNAVGKVIGKGGANLANIQKISGAIIEISEPRSSRGDRVAHVSGTSEQKRSAENLIQAFILAI